MSFYNCNMLSGALVEARGRKEWHTLTHICAKNVENTGNGVNIVLSGSSLQSDFQNYSPVQFRSASVSFKKKHKKVTVTGTKY